MDVSNKILIMLWENDIINTSSLVEKLENYVVVSLKN